jgi:hypothetical protein
MHPVYYTMLTRIWQNVIIVSQKCFKNWKKYININGNRFILEGFQNSSYALKYTKIIGDGDSIEINGPKEYYTRIECSSKMFYSRTNRHLKVTPM